MITSSIQDILMMYAWEDDNPTTKTSEIIDHSKGKLFDFDYPLYDTAMKDQFERDFIRHFYTRQIGSESIALFKLRLQDYLYLNHEKWERLYQALDSDVNPFHNIDVKTIRSTDEQEHTNRDSTDDETSSGSKEVTGSDSANKTIGKTGTDDRTQVIDTTGSETIDTSQDTSVHSTSDDFTRSLEQDTPDERLGITAQDGVGVIDYASQINENKNTNDSNQTTGVTGNSVKGTTDKKETSDTRSTTGDETHSHTGTQQTDESDTRSKQRTALENQLRSFEQALDEHQIGRRLNQSFVTVYDEYIQHFQGLHRHMFKELDKLFLGVF